jgi:hypothetical protein
MDIKIFEEIEEMEGTEDEKTVVLWTRLVNIS